MSPDIPGDPNRVYIFDTTLRDGEQVPGASLNLKEKLEVARFLERLNVDVIEAGFPVSSPGDFEAVAAVAAEIRGPEICGLARAVEKDITVCADAIKGARRPRLHTFVGTSDVNISSQLKKSREQVMKIAVDSVSLARSLCEVVEFSPMDATRTDIGYLCEVVAATIEAGATVINIPDTVGYAVPEQFGAMIREIFARVPNVHNAIISVHCHDDLGMATINSLTAVTNGARQIECTVNGVGERAGNTSLEECAMAIRTRKDFFGELYTGINTKEIMPASRAVSRMMNMPVPANKPVVGGNAFSHSSGIHQDGVIKERATFEIMNPEDVGITESRLVLTARSGRRALSHRLSELGYSMTKEQLEQTYERFLAVADKKKEVHDADLEAIVRDELRTVPQVYTMGFVQVLSGSKLVPTATVGLKKGDELFQEAANGDGPVDAVYNAIERITHLKVELTDYTINAVTGGRDAMGQVVVRVQHGGRTFVGVGSSTDVIEASAHAMLDAINKVVNAEDD